MKEILKYTVIETNRFGKNDLNLAEISIEELKVYFALL